MSKVEGLKQKYDVFKAGTNEEVRDCIVLKFSDPLSIGAIITWATTMRDNGYIEVYHDVMEIVKVRGLESNNE